MNATSPVGTPAPVNLLEVLWRRKVLVVCITLLAAAGGYLYAQTQPTVYRSSARLVLKDPRSTTTLFEESRQPGGGDLTRSVRARAQYALSTPVLQRAAGLLPGQTPGQIRGKLTVEAAKDLDMLTVSALDATPAGAAALANAVGTAYREVVGAENRARAEATRREFQGTAAALRQRITQLQGAVGSSRSDGADDGYNTARTTAVNQLLNYESRADGVLIDATLYGDGVALFEPARPPAAPAQPRPLGAAFVAGLLGFLAAFGLAWWRAEHRRTVDDRHQAAAVLGAPLLGDVPAFAAVGVAGSIPARDAAHSVLGEAYHFLVTSVGFALARNGGNTIVVTSAGPGEGKTVTSINLAIAAVQDGRRVVVVDADARERGLTLLADVPAQPGLTDLTDDSVPVPYVISNLAVGSGTELPIVPIGSVHESAGFFRTQAFRRAVQRLREAADLVVLDSPPLLDVSDTSGIAAQADGIVLVVKKGTPVRQLRDVRERLDLIGAPLLGYVFTGSDLRRGTSAYAYRSARVAQASRPLVRLTKRIRETV